MAFLKLTGLKSSEKYLLWKLFYYSFLARLGWRVW